ncbi:hypothetical protein EVAR_81992_1 [Eumeta japonica]|uniref:Uncharacterized protein n=1 Tax=Eumeta variegata TaxID=151549 RepID=A0A4C1VVX1_EUMVA|nr:hypothetical protein EVAR_81992_1 [Eumeta japonica]
MEKINHFIERNGINILIKNVPNLILTGKHLGSTPPVTDDGGGRRKGKNDRLSGVFIKSNKTKPSAAKNNEVALREHRGQQRHRQRDPREAPAHAFVATTGATDLCVLMSTMEVSRVCGHLEASAQGDQMHPKVRKMPKNNRTCSNGEISVVDLANDARSKKERRHGQIYLFTAKYGDPIRARHKEYNDETQVYENLKLFA